MFKEIKVITTDHFVNQIITKKFSTSCKGKLISINEYKFNEIDTIATYGILRGTGELLKISNSFWYIDHGYFKGSKRTFKQGTNILDLNGYFRIVYNGFFHNGKGNYSSDRFNKLNISPKPIKKNGSYIILSEPSENIKKFFGLINWKENTINEIKKYTDRKIFIHNKNSKIDLMTLLKNDWAFVGLQSTAGLKAMIEGIPAHFTLDNLQNINPLKKIEERNIDIKIFNNLAYGQWTLKEIESGEAWDFISKNNYSFSQK
jgi:hypothetical protein